MREISIRPRAQLDIESTFIYIALELHEPQTARNLIDTLYEAFDRLAAFPESGRLVSDDSLEQEYRRSLVGRYWIYYTFDDSFLTVWRVFHTRQDIENYSLIDY